MTAAYPNELGQDPGTCGNHEYEQAQNPIEQENKHADEENDPHDHLAIGNGVYMSGNVYTRSQGDTESQER